MLRGILRIISLQGGFKGAAPLLQWGVEDVYTVRRGAQPLLLRRGGIGVRLDKFLKVSRVIKRRTVAKEVCDQGQVTINGRAAKAGTEVQPGDRVEISLGERMIRLEILEVRENVAARDASGLYRILEN